MPLQPGWLGEDWHRLGARLAGVYWPQDELQSADLPGEGRWGPCIPVCDTYRGGQSRVAHSVAAGTAGPGRLALGEMDRCKTLKGILWARMRVERGRVECGRVEGRTAGIGTATLGGAGGRGQGRWGNGEGQRDEGRSVEVGTCPCTTAKPSVVL